MEEVLSFIISVRIDLKIKIKHCIGTIGPDVALLGQVL